MSKEKRQETVEILTQTLDGSTNLYFTDFSGLSVAHMTEFRAKLRAVGARYLVVKNTLARRALSASQISGIEGSIFAGPTGVVLVGEDPLPAAKVIGDFAKAHTKPTVKIGLVDGAVVEADYVQRLGLLPSRDVLLSHFVGALNGMLYHFVGALKALHEQRQSAAS
jgi:large subunit ribosomal protein L10